MVATLELDSFVLVVEVNEATVIALMSADLFMKVTFDINRLSFLPGVLIALKALRPEGVGRKS